MRAICLLSSAAILACSSGGSATHKVGDACKTSQDCGNLLRCYTDATPSICTNACGDSSTCSAGSACAPLLSSLGSGLCLLTCTSNASCGTGYTCCEALGNVCAPASKCTGTVPVDTGSTLQCAPRTIVNGGRLGPAQQPALCLKPVTPVAFAGAQVQAFGAHLVGDEVSFNVPAGTGTISIVEQVIDGGAPDQITLNNARLPNTVVPFHVTAPDGGVFYNDDVQPNLDLSTMEVVYSSQTAAVGAMTLPNTTLALSHLAQGGYPAGTWTMQVNDYAYECFRGDSTTHGCTTLQNTQSYDLQVVTKPVMGDTGTVDIGIYLISTNWTAGIAIADANGDWTRFLDTLAGIYANAGLCLGKVTFYDPPSWAKNAYSTSVDATDLTPCGVLDQMFTLSQPGGEVPVFFVDDIKAAGTQGSGQVIVGIDGSIPGPAGAGGTVHSGAVVNVADLSTTGCGANPQFTSCGADEIAYIVAHEGGHFMGLYHTTESNGSLFDPIGDTSQCAPGCDANLDGILVGSECKDDSSTTLSCGGASDLMFWLLSPQAKGLISPQQARVMRASPVVYRGSGQ